MHPLVSTQWLADRLHDPRVQIVDASWYMLPADGDGAADHARAHIPGAVYFGIDDIADHRSNLPHMLPTPAAFAEAAGRLGLRREAALVVYNGAGSVSAPRVWWSLRVMGFNDVVVLDGGLCKWRAEARPIESGLTPVAATTLSPAYRPALVRDLASVREGLAWGDVQLVDARPAARFRGEAPEPRPGLRGGCMPGAYNVPWQTLLDGEGCLRAAGDLRKTFETARVDLRAPIITTCGSGVTAAILSLALARLGVPDAPVYDGSWAEWGGRSDTPVSSEGRQGARLSHS